MSKLRKRRRIEDEAAGSLHNFWDNLFGIGNVSGYAEGSTSTNTNDTASSSSSSTSTNVDGANRTTTTTTTTTATAYASRLYSDPAHVDG